jgi:ssDNA-binding replication factor A large subunit
VVGFVQFVTGNLFNNKLIDESGSIKLTLWADDTEKVKDGDMVSIEGGYTTTFRDEIQLNKGRKDGKLEVTSG